jgi:hypothetical protein
MFPADPPAPDDDGSTAHGASDATWPFSDVDVDVRLVDELLPSSWPTSDRTP